MHNEPKAVGILGGGQLALMLAEAAVHLGVNPVIFTGKPSDPQALKNFFSKVQLVVFENEFLDCQILAAAAEKLDVTFIPSLETIELLQDKLQQKNLLARLGIPTSPFEVAAQDEVPAAWVARALKKFGGTCVFKWARMGYDGKGVLIHDESKSLELAVSFCAEALQKGYPVYAEKKIRFKRELALIACNSTREEFVTYPLVVSEQTEGICSRVTGPAYALGVPGHLEDQAKDFARRIAEEAGLHGSFALELFEADSEELLVNEIAPRVHNSGHYTQDAADTSQFENHLRAALGMSLGSTETSPGFAMLNLLGPPGVTLSEQDFTMPKAYPKVHVHWYGKTEIRPGRKLGHLNGTANSPEELADLLNHLQHYHDQWVIALRNALQKLKKKK